MVTKPVTMLIVAQVAGRAAVVAACLAHAALPRRRAAGTATSTCSTAPIGSARKRVPARRNCLRVAGREEAVVAAPVLVVARGPASRSRVSTSAAIASPELTIATPPAQLALEHRAHERVVGAAEDHGVHAGALERPAGALDAGERAVVDLAARPGSAGPARPRRPRAARRPGAASASARGVGAAGHRGRRGDQPDPAVARGRGGQPRLRRRPRRPRARCRSSSSRSAGSAAAVAELQATTSSLAPRVEQDAGELARRTRAAPPARGRRRESARCRRGRGSPRAEATRGTRAAR